MGEGDVTCPLCGERSPKGARRCDNCGAALPDARGEGVRRFAESLKVDEGTVRRLQESGFEGGPSSGSGGGGTLYLCPSCGSLVGGTDVACGKCGAALSVEGSETKAEDARPCPYCGATIHLAAEVCPWCGKSIAPAPDADDLPRVCPECGSLAPTGHRTCAVCGTSLAATGREPAAPTPAPVPAPRAEPKPPASPPAAAPSGTEPLAVKPAPVPARPPPSGAIRREAARPAPAKTEVPPRPPVHRPLPRLDEGAVEPAARFRELAVIGTAIALLAAALVASANVAGHEWGNLFLFGVLFGIGAVLSVPDLRSLPRIDLLLFLLGMALLAAGPATADAGRPLGADAPLAVAGTGLLALVVWRTRAGVGPLLFWLAGLLLLTALAYEPLAGVAPSTADAALWAIGGAMSLGTATFVAIRRWFRTAAAARLARADSESARREFEKAIASYDGGIGLARRAGRESAAGWYGKGATLVAMGRLPEAVAALDRALALNPENEIAWINKGTALSRMGQMNEALRCYNSAIKVNPSYEVAWNNKGNALARLGRHELALECYDRALVIDGSYRTAWVNKGFVLTKLGRFEEAATCADTALRLTDGIPAGA